MTPEATRRENFTRAYFELRRKNPDFKEMAGRFEAKPWADCGGYYARLSDDGWWVHSWFGGASVYPPDDDSKTWFLK